MPFFILPFWSPGAISNSSCCPPCVCCCWPLPFRLGSGYIFRAEEKRVRPGRYSPRRQRGRLLAHDDFLVGKRRDGPAFWPRLVGRALRSPVALIEEIKLRDGRTQFSMAAAGVRLSPLGRAKSHAGSCCSVSTRSEHAVIGMEPKAGAARISMHESGRHTRTEHRANRSAQ